MKTLDGLKIAGYEILRPLAHGGMGQVFVAKQSSLDRIVALKVLSSDDGLDEESRHRFERESSIQMQLAHPNLVKVFDSGIADGVCFMAMELVEGLTLQEYITRAAPLPADFIVPVTRQIVSALACAHQSGVVHRDVKPANILISNAGVAKLADFGVALSVFQTRITADASVFGSLSYLAPEVIRGDEASRSADLYAMGVVLYEMAAGALPFPEKDFETLVNMIVFGEPLPLHTRAPGIPEGLISLTMALLAREPDDRPESANVIERLDALREGRHRFGSSGISSSSLFRKLRMNAVEEGNPEPEAHSTVKSAAIPVQTTPRRGEGNQGRVPRPPPEVEDAQLHRSEPMSPGGDTGKLTLLSTLIILVVGLLAFAVSWIQSKGGLPIEKIVIEIRSGEIGVDLVSGKELNGFQIDMGDSNRWIPLMGSSKRVPDQSSENHLFTGSLIGGHWLDGVQRSIRVKQLQTTILMIPVPVLRGAGPPATLLRMRLEGCPPGIAAWHARYSEPEDRNAQWIEATSKDGVTQFTFKPPGIWGRIHLDQIKGQGAIKPMNGGGGNDVATEFSLRPDMWAWTADELQEWLPGELERRFRAGSTLHPDAVDLFAMICGISDRVSVSLALDAFQNHLRTSLADAGTTAQMRRDVLAWLAACTVAELWCRERKIPPPVEFMSLSQTIIEESRRPLSAHINPADHNILGFYDPERSPPVPGQAFPINITNFVRQAILPERPDRPPQITRLLEPETWGAIHRVVIQGHEEITTDDPVGLSLLSWDQRRRGVFHCRLLDKPGIDLVFCNLDDESHIKAMGDATRVNSQQPASWLNAPLAGARHEKFIPRSLLGKDLPQEALIRYQDIAGTGQPPTYAVLLDLSWFRIHRHP